MKTMNIFKKALLGLSGLTAMFLVASMATTHAIPYTGPTTPPSPVPAFNVYTGAPAPDSNEADFLKARVPATPTGDTTTPYVDPLNASCAAGQRIQMRVYVHNGASVEGNQGGSGPSVAHGTKVKVTIPGTEAASFTPNATISATNAASVSDGVQINCNGKVVKLRYIPGSASSFSKGTGVVPVSDSITTTGAPIRSQNVPGDVWGCWDDRVYVILSVEVVEIPTPPPVSTGSCKALEPMFLTDRRLRVKVVGEVNNATITGYEINWGDGSAVSNKQEDTHQFGVGNFTVVGRVRVKFANGSEQWVTSNGCKLSVKYTEEKNKCPIPGKEDKDIDSPECKVVVTPPPAPPTTLPSTGAGSLAAIFTAVSAGGAMAYRSVVARRLSRD